MRFIKMQGTGNDYVYVDAFREKVADPVALSQTISHRRFGIGADGLILIKPSPGVDAEMEMYNADGSKSEMCGNGLRCVAKYVHDTYAPGKNSFQFLTGAGLRGATITGRDAAGHAETVQLDMGVPVFNARAEPVAAIGMSVPSIRFTRAQARAMAFKLCDAALHASQALGFSPVHLTPTNPARRSR